MVGELLPPLPPNPERAIEPPAPALDVSSLDPAAIVLLVEQTASQYQGDSVSHSVQNEAARALFQSIENGIAQLVHQNVDNARQVIYDIARSRSDKVRNMATPPLGHLLLRQHDLGDKRQHTTAAYLVGIFRDQELEQPSELHGARNVISGLLEAWWLDPEILMMFTRELAKLESA